MLAGLERLVPAAQRNRAIAIDREIVGLDGPRIAARVHELIANTVRRHEAQHGLDHAPAHGSARDSARDRKAPSDPWASAGASDAADSPPAFARGELSAYLSQIANDPVTPQLAYWHVAVFAFDQRTWAGAEPYAAVAITSGLARHLKLTTDGPLIHDREIDRRRLGLLAMAIAKQPDDALRAAARATWQDQFGAPLATIVDRPARAAAPAAPP